MAYYNRRRFLQGSTAAMGVAAGAGLLSMAAPAHATATGYKALVCLILGGGLDHADTVLPTDRPSWDALRGYRSSIFDGYGVGSGSSSRDIENLLPLDAANIAKFGGRTFGLPPEMASLHAMFSAGEMAVIGNTGALIEPTTRETIANGSVRLPPKRHSHNDQESYFQTLGVEGRKPGWGGRFIDELMGDADRRARTFASMRMADGLAGGTVPFLAGERTRPFSVPIIRPWEYDIFKRPKYLGGYMDDPTVEAGLRAHLASRDVASSNLFMSDMAEMSARARRDIDDFRSAYFAGADITTEFPSTRTGSQLRDIARSIAIRGRLGGPSRQVFGVRRGGFDIHAGQTTAQPRMLAEIDEALAAFRSAMIEIGEWSNVCVFTGTDFGRTTIGNGNGTDHGWGGHAFVMGGSVSGRRILGDIPPVDFSDPSYSKSRGRLIPGVSTETYAASLGSWFGLGSGVLDTIFPNRRNFDTLDLELFI